MKVENLLNGKNWCIPAELQPLLSSSLLPEISGEEDQTIRGGNIYGQFSVSAAVDKLRLRELKLTWLSFIWKPFLHPSIASSVCKLQHNIFVGDEVMRTKGYDMVSRCCACLKEQDNMYHTLWKCTFSIEIWNWICSIFQFQKPESFEDICKAAKHKSPLIKEIWMTAACAIMKELWFQRNKIFFEGGISNCNSFKTKIRKMVLEGGYRMTGNRWDQAYDSQVISYFNLGIRNIKFSRIKECFWAPPDLGYALFYCDGASFGNPGSSVFGIVIRDNICQIWVQWLEELGLLLTLLQKCMLSYVLWNG